MEHPLERDANVLPDQLDPQLLRELEQQSIHEIQKLRAHERLEMRTGLEVLPANSSDRSGFSAQGYTEDISQGGSKAFFPIPINVGDVYRLRFDKKVLDLPIVYARCLRCIYLREDAFEVAFQFFTSITLNPSRKRDGHLLD